MQWHIFILSFVFCFNFNSYCTSKELILVRDKMSETHLSGTAKTTKKAERNPRYLHSMKTLRTTLRKNYQSIVSGVNIDDMRNELERSEESIAKRIEEAEKTKEKQTLKEYIQFYLPKVCRLIYTKEKPDVRIELKTIMISIERILLLVINKSSENILVPYNLSSQENVAKIQLGREVVGKFRKENSICIGKVLFMPGYFNTSQNVYDIKLYSSEKDDTPLDLMFEDFDILVEIPVKNKTNVTQCVMWTDNRWDPTRCKTLSITQSVAKCGCKALGYYSIVSIESTSATTTTSPMLKTSTAVTQSPFVPFVSVSTKLTTIIPDKLIKTSTERVLATDNGNSSKITTERTETQGANITFITLIALLSIGIVSLLSTWGVIYHRNKKKNAIEDTTVSYGRYFDEHTLEELPEEV